MTEGELGTAIATELRTLGWRAFKLHGDAVQRGMPDWICWRDGGPVIMFELKRATSWGKADQHITSGQRSVLESLANSAAGAFIVYGERAARLVQGGIAEWRGAQRTCTPIVGDSKADFAQRVAVELDTRLRALEKSRAVVAIAQPGTVG